MATRWAVASGNWSNTATWNGGTLPASTDDVYANNFTVNIDQSITVNSLKKIAGSGITAGGSFVATAAATITITAGIAATDNETNSSYLLGVNAGSAAVVINANIVGGANTGRVAVQVLSGHTGSVTITGSLSSGDAGGWSTAYALGCASNSATITVNGNLVGSSSRYSTILFNSGSAPTITVNGDVSGNRGNTHGISNTGASAVINVNGTVTGGQAGYGINLAGGQLTVVGSVVGGTFANYGIYATAGSLRLDALMKFGANGCAPIHCEGVVPQFKRTSTVLGIQAPSDDNWPLATGSAITLGAGGGATLPDPADVRDGVMYGEDDAVAGTLTLPPAESVAAGVPFDDTVGTAALKLSDVAAVTGAQIAAATSG